MKREFSGAAGLRLLVLETDIFDTNPDLLRQKMVHTVRFLQVSAAVSPRRIESFTDRFRASVACYVIGLARLNLLNFNSVLTTLPYIRPNHHQHHADCYWNQRIWPHWPPCDARGAG